MLVHVHFEDEPGRRAKPVRVCFRREWSEGDLALAVTITRGKPGHGYDQCTATHLSKERNGSEMHFGSGAGTPNFYLFDFYLFDATKRLQSRTMD